MGVGGAGCTSRWEGGMERPVLVPNYWWPEGGGLSLMAGGGQ